MTYLGDSLVVVFLQVGLCFHEISMLVHVPLVVALLQVVREKVLLFLLLLVGLLLYILQRDLHKLGERSGAGGGSGRAGSAGKVGDDRFG